MNVPRKLCKLIPMIFIFVACKSKIPTKETFQSMQTALQETQTAIVVETAKEVVSDFSGGFEGRGNGFCSTYFHIKDRANDLSFLRKYFGELDNNNFYNSLSSDSFIYSHGVDYSQYQVDFNKKLKIFSKLTFDVAGDELSYNFNLPGASSEVTFDMSSASIASYTGVKSAMSLLDQVNSFIANNGIDVNRTGLMIDKRGYQCLGSLSSDTCIKKIPFRFQGCSSSREALKTLFLLKLPYLAN